MIFDKPIANDDQPRLQGANDGPASPDRVQPFMLDASHLRGRMVRLPHVLDAIITAHGYPEHAARILGQALCLTTLLAGMLKFDGVFTFQAKSQGLIKTLVCDITTDGTLRGYASYDAEALKVATDPNFSELMHNGYLSFTVDQAEGGERYQGIVALDGTDLTDCVRHYFSQSEQIQTAFVSHIGKNADGKWIGGALMLQHLPETPASSPEDWQRAMLLMQTLTYNEMVENALPLNNVLYRLFHEEGVRIFPPIAIQKGCRCSAERIRSVLDNLSEDDRLDVAENGIITVTCEFCNIVYEFPV